MIKRYRALQTQRGQEAVERVANKLRQWNLYKHIEIADGNNAVPDIICKKEPSYIDGEYLIGIEVKTIQSYVKDIKENCEHVGRVCLPRQQWNGLQEWSKSHNSATLEMIVEIRVLRSKIGFLYFKIKEGYIDQFFGNKQNEMMGISMWEVINVGEKI